MALVVTDVGGADRIDPSLKGLVFAIKDVAFDSSYPTGGEALSAASLGMTTILGVVCIGGAGGYVYEYDRTNSKIIAYRQTAATSALIEVANAVDLSALTAVRYLVIGTPLH